MDFRDGAGQRPAFLLTGERHRPESVGVASPDLLALGLERRLARRREPSLDAVNLSDQLAILGQHDVLAQIGRAHV